MLLRVQEVVCTARAMENSAVVGCPEAICGRLVQSTVVWHGSATLRDGCDFECARRKGWRRDATRRHPACPERSDCGASAFVPLSIMLPKKASLPWKLPTLQPELYCIDNTFQNAPRFGQTGGLSRSTEFRSLRAPIASEA